MAGIKLSVVTGNNHVDDTRYIRDRDGASDKSLYPCTLNRSFTAFSLTRSLARRSFKSTSPFRPTAPLITLDPLAATFAWKLFSRSHVLASLRKLLQWPRIMYDMYKK